MTVCPVCETPLIPILYGYVDKKYLDMHEAGLALIVDKTFHKKTDPTSYCNKCHEAYNLKVD